MHNNYYISAFQYVVSFNFLSPLASGFRRSNYERGFIQSDFSIRYTNPGKKRTKELRNIYKISNFALFSGNGV